MERAEALRRAHAVCAEMEDRMRRIGVATTAHYDVGAVLIADALQEAASCPPRLDERTRMANGEAF